MSFKDKVVLVTGASSGIGAATAVKFAEEAANVVIIGRNEERLNIVAEKCKQFSGKSLPIIADVTKDEDVKNMIEKTIEEFGKLDILINNAGLGRKVGILDENYIESYDIIMNTNMRAIALTTNLAVPHIIKSNGNIVNVSAVGGKKAGQYFSAYQVSKAALDHFTRCIALELAPHGVRVNSISPGPVHTSIFDTAGLPGALDMLKTRTALGKISDSDEVANLILYLASDKASSITGSDYGIDNGFFLK